MAANANTALSVERDHMPAILERVLVTGDLARLTPDERIEYYAAVCRSVGLNPLTQPFSYIVLNGKLTLYALKTATDQLRQIHHVSLGKPEIEIINDVLIVTITAVMQDGRTDTDIGAVALEGKRGDNLANAYKKGITQAKRRVTLAICGLGMLDESEVEDVPAERRRAVTVDTATGEVFEPRPRAIAADTTPAGLPIERKPGANFGGYCTDGEAARIRELAPGKGIDLSGLDNQRLPWRVIVNAVRERGGAVTVAPDGGISAREVGEALKALPDVADAGDEEFADDAPESDNAVGEDFYALVDQKIADARA